VERPSIAGRLAHELRTLPHERKRKQRINRIKGKPTPELEGSQGSCGARQLYPRVSSLAKLEAQRRSWPEKALAEHGSKIAKSERRARQGRRSRAIYQEPLPLGPEAAEMWYCSKSAVIWGTPAVAPTYSGSQPVTLTGTRSTHSFDCAISARLNLRRNSNTEVLSRFGVDR
jgi:hypothetical protein